MSSPAAAGAGAASFDSSSSSSSSSSSTNLLVEGQARIPYTDAEGVFYNKVQVFNRDLSILMITTFQCVRQEERQAKARAAHDAKLKRLEKQQQQQQHAGSSGSITTASTTTDLAATTAVATAVHPIRILEALSATGLRSIRYFREIPHVEHILVNDLMADAIQRTVHGAVATNQGDAKLVMYTHCAEGKQFDVVDLDPYGSAAEFIDGAVQSVTDGGLLCITCTDKAVLCGSYGETSFAKYGGFSLKGKICHEMAIRLLLGALQQSATRYRRHITPLASMSIDFYVRVFVRVHTSQSAVKRSASQMASVYQCVGCESFFLQRLGKVADDGHGHVKYSAAGGPPCDSKCPHCHRALRIGGPMWADPLHDKAFVERALADVSSRTQDFATHKRIIGMLTLLRDELPDPFYYTVSGLCLTLHVEQPKIQMLRAALIHAGYAVSQTHALPDALKTNAPSHVVWDIMRCYVKTLAEVGNRTRSADEPCGTILSVEPKLEANFEYVEGCDLSLKTTGVPKFLPNPEENWGPKARAKKRNADAVDGGDANGAAESTPQGMTKKQKQRDANKKARAAQHLCKNFREKGFCSFGDACKYVH